MFYFYIIKSSPWKMQWDTMMSIIREREREIKFIGLFENRGHRGPYSPYKPFNHNLYIGIIIFPHIDNPQYTGYDLPKKKPNKIINAKKVRAPLIWQIIGEKDSGSVFNHQDLNPLRAKFFRGNINIYLHFVSFLPIDTTLVVEILPQIRQEPIYFTEWISWLLMSWRRKEPGHQQPWYWLS